MRILKKNGLDEKFDIDKIKTSIANSATDIGLPLTESDLNILLSEIVKELYKAKDTSLIISSHEIRKIVCKMLINYGFHKIAKSYMDLDV